LKYIFLELVFYTSCSEDLCLITNKEGMWRSVSSQLHILDIGKEPRYLFGHQFCSG